MECAGLGQLWVDDLRRVHRTRVPGRRGRGHRGPQALVRAAAEAEEAQEHYKFYQNFFLKH